jgi:glyoxylate reductase
VNPKLVRLAKAGKVVLLPHMGSATIEGRVEMGEKVMINIRTFLDGHRRRIACCRAWRRFV